MSGFGRTWWSKRWLRTLELLGLSYPDNRMAKARSLARRDAVDLMHLEPGELSAFVDEPPKSFGVTVTVSQFDTDQWQRCVAQLAPRLANLAALLDDQLPSGVDRQLEPAGLSLFPGDGEISTNCPCRDSSQVCIHVIAVQHAFSAWLDDDPFLLWRLRGYEREEVIDGLRAGSAAEPPHDPAKSIVASTLDGQHFYLAHGSIETALRP